MGEFGAALTLVAVIFCIILAVLWIMMPFAVFKSRELLGRIVTLTEENNRVMTKLLEAQSMAARRID